MKDSNIVSIAANIGNRVRLEVLGDEQRLLEFANIDWEATFRQHGRPVLSDLVARTEVKPFQVIAHSEFGPVSAVSAWSSTTKDSFITEWARIFTDLTFVYSSINEVEGLVETRIRRVDHVVSTGMDYSDWPHAKPSDYPELAFDLYARAMCDADLPCQFHPECWEI